MNTFFKDYVKHKQSFDNYKPKSTVILSIRVIMFSVVLPANMFESVNKKIRFRSYANIGI